MSEGEEYTFSLGISIKEGDVLIEEFTSHDPKTTCYAEAITAWFVEYINSAVSGGDSVQENVHMEGTDSKLVRFFKGIQELSNQLYPEGIYEGINRVGPEELTEEEMLSCNESEENVYSQSSFADDTKKDFVMTDSTSSDSSLKHFYIWGPNSSYLNREEGPVMKYLTHQQERDKDVATLAMMEKWDNSQKEAMELLNSKILNAQDEVVILSFSMGSDFQIQLMERI